MRVKEYQKVVKGQKKKKKRKKKAVAEVRHLITEQNSSKKRELNIMNDKCRFGDKMKDVISFT